MNYTQQYSRGLLVLLALLLPRPLFPGEPDWKAGLASATITPEKPVLMAGYASRTKPFEKVEGDLYAKALALEDAQGRRAVLVTTDLIGLSAAVAEPICQRINERSGLKREQILLSWAHNHAGPSLSLKATPGSSGSAEDAENTVAYTRNLQDQLVALVGQALARLEPARLSWGSGVANFVMNRREFTPTGVILGVNPKGPADRSVPVLRVDAADGRPRAVLFGCACHNTTLTHTNYAVCGDYAGYAQEHIQQRYPAVQALFMMGCGGDANPYPRGTLQQARQHGTELGLEVCRVMETKLRPVSGPLALAYDFASLPLQSPGRAELEKIAATGPSWQTGNARQMLSLLERGEKLPADFRCPVAVWQFGNDLTLVALSGEVVVDYVPLLERALGPLQLWLAAYCHESFGYLPSARVLAEGGYENRGLGSGQGWFAPAAQDVLVEKVRQMAKQAGRKVPD